MTVLYFDMYLFITSVLIILDIIISQRYKCTCWRMYRHFRGTHDVTLQCLFLFITLVLKWKDRDTVDTCMQNLIWIPLKYCTRVDKKNPLRLQDKQNVSTHQIGIYNPLVFIIIHLYFYFCFKYLMIEHYFAELHTSLKRTIKSTYLTSFL